jgi:hypothetical protein
LCPGRLCFRFITILKCIRNWIVIFFAIASARATAAASPADCADASPAPRHYSLRLNALVLPQPRPDGYAASQESGLFLKVRFDGGRPLRMLLDSGAQDIVLDKRAAAALGRSGGVPWELVGLGPAATSAKRVASATLAMGDLVLSGCRILVAATRLAEGIDGVIPLAVFADFLVRLDASRKTLELDPYPAELPAAGYTRGAGKGPPALSYRTARSGGECGAR